MNFHARTDSVEAIEDWDFLMWCLYMFIEERKTTESRCLISTISGFFLLVVPKMVRSDL